MNKYISCLLVFALALSPCLALAASSIDNSTLAKQEINNLNSLPGSKALLTHTGGRCWQTCADNDYGHLNCSTTCDDDSGSSGGGGGGGENVMLSPLAIGLYCVLLAVCIYWIMQSAQAGASVGA
jgi:hypothetical protein